VNLRRKLTTAWADDVDVGAVDVELAHLCVVLYAEKIFARWGLGRDGEVDLMVCKGWYDRSVARCRGANKSAYRWLRVTKPMLSCPPLWCIIPGE